DAHRPQQPLVGRAHARARDADHPDGPRLGGDGKHERGADPAFRERGAVHGARVAPDVGDPERLAGLPHLAGEALARAEHELARRVDQLLDARDRRAPGIAEAQHLVVVGVPVAPAVPDLGLAQRPDHGAQARRAALGLGEAARDRVLEAQQLLLALARGDVLADAAVAAELARVVEDRLAADARVAGIAFRVG